MSQLLFYSSVREGESVVRFGNVKFQIRLMITIQMCNQTVINIFKMRILNFQNENTKIINNSYKNHKLRNSKIFKREHANDVTKVTAKT